MEFAQPPVAARGGAVPWRRLLIAVFCVGSMAGCAATAGGAGAEVDPAQRVSLDGEQRSVKVGVLRQPHLSHPLFYEGFRPSNVRLEIVPFANSTEIKNAVVSGDLAFGVTGITAALQGASNDEPIVVVAAAADGGSAIVAGRDRGIASVSDLRGKKIGYVPGSAQDILLRLTLQGNGLDPTTDVQLVNVQFADMAPALARGDIDAFSGAETGPSDALVGGEAVLVTRPYDTRMGKINIVLVTNRDTIDADPALVQAMVDVHAKATDSMRDDTAAWIDAVTDKYGFSEKSLAMAVDNIELRWRLDDAYLEQARVLGAEQLRLEQIRKEPDYARFIDQTFSAKAA
ncbi:NrtA/SsuA/CpmA family ABC transporter substrate-binding protein [Solwaraspora sp. WMMD1047]|uniref:ABC transporter substrate-binding protein n=1 Tax=Solwaraspora sp. WMMD1047 TaxID=3016102 RepID=UPI002417A5AA|nr:NrtA/SsuA/CpmA family ABC transporter substrate-binding protein [Solwaraspora sp. WMMD1047]MDG4834452.1 NrtA/SsuA/CpmA family ABC transporter substrate-binding protein [Solwaraspora sp. WMMD1047]